MSFTLVAHTAKSSSDGQQVTTNNVNTTGAKLIVVETAEYQPYIIPFTDSFSNVWTPLTNYGGSLASARLYFCIAPTVGANHNFHVPSGLISFPALAVQAWSTPNTPALYYSQNGHVAQTPTSATPGTVTPIVNGALIITGAVSDNGQPTAASGFTVSDTVNFTSQGLGIAMAYLQQAIAATINPTWTGTGLEATNIAVFTETAPAPTNLTLALGSASGIPGGSVTLVLNIEVPSGVFPTAIQWAFSFTSDLTLTAVTIGAAATAASKTLSQVGSDCVVWGVNTNVINSGVLVTAIFTISLTPSTGSIPVSITGIVASDASANPITVVEISGTITTDLPVLACPISGDSAVLNTPYTKTLVASGGVPPYTYSIIG